MVLTFLVLGFVLLPKPAGAFSSSLVVSEVQTQSATSQTQEFVELYNRSPSAVDVTGWKVEYVTASGGTTTALATLSGSVAGHSFVLLSRTGFLAVADYFFGAGLAEAGGHVRIVDASKQVIDLLGWGTAVAPEGLVVASPAKGSTLRRESNPIDLFKDTDVNATDFVTGQPDPQTGPRQMPVEEPPTVPPSDPQIPPAEETPVPEPAPADPPIDPEPVPDPSQTPDPGPAPAPEIPPSEPSQPPVPSDPEPTTEPPVDSTEPPVEPTQTPEPIPDPVPVPEPTPEPAPAPIPPTTEPPQTPELPPSDLPAPETDPPQLPPAQPPTPPPIDIPPVACHLYNYEQAQHAYGPPPATVYLPVCSKAPLHNSNKGRVLATYDVTLFVFSLSIR